MEELLKLVELVRQEAPRARVKVDSLMVPYYFTIEELLNICNEYADYKCILANIICRFNTYDKRMVKVISSDDVFEGEVTKMEWDVDQWTYFVNGEWYCQSEINGI